MREDLIRDGLDSGYRGQFTLTTAARGQASPWLRALGSEGSGLGPVA